MSGKKKGGGGGGGGGGGRNEKGFDSRCFDGQNLFVRELKLVYSTRATSMS